MTRLALPDCRAHVDAFTLSPEDRRELVRRIAEHGAGAIDDFIREREAQGDTSIARRVRKLRDELLRRAQELKERLRNEYAEREATLAADYERKLAQLQGERAQYEAQLSGLSARKQAALDAALRANPALGLALDAGAAARIPWWRRAWRAFVRVLRWIFAPLLWLLRKLFPPAKLKHRKEALLLFPAEGALARAGDLYLGNPTFRRSVRERMRAAPASERVRRAWERLLGREDYESLARAAMAQMIEEEAAKTEAKVDESRRGLQEALAEVDRRAREEAERTQEGRRALREQEARDAESLTRSLREAPEAEVKAAIVEEMQAAGLLRAKDLVPTLQFMDRFAGLVYEDETKGGPSQRGASAGELAEGEGLFVRSPLQSVEELSRMDIPASLLRARSRHPKVRHLTEADVVVHREDRAMLTHVVVIVDRSGSMEENGRMEAAKRAALALHHAVRRAERRNPIDVLLMDTSVEPATLREVWDAKPRAFTNTGAALRMARHLAQRRRSGRTLVYLVTDGLPEAYTKDGVDVAGHPEKAMAYAKKEARALAATPGFAGLVMLLLEPKDAKFADAARALAEEAKGRVVDVDPQELARTLVGQFESR